VLFVNEFILVSYYNMGQILKLVLKKNCNNIGRFQRSVTDIRDRIYNNITEGIIA
jgi:hypothetical protein